VATAVSGGRRAALRIAALVTLAGLVRALVAARTAVPERDAAHYLWMADGLLAGAPGRLWQSVFHPVFPALIGGFRALCPELDPVVAGQIVACLASALTVWPLWILTSRLFGARAADAAALCFALGTWFARHPADALSEGLFHLLVTTAVCLLVGGDPIAAGAATETVAASSLARRPGRPRPLHLLGPLAPQIGASRDDSRDYGPRGRRQPILAGVLTALAYGTRPEGAGLGLVACTWLLRGGQRTRAAAFAAGCATALAFPLGWAVWGPGFTLTPKAGFVWADGMGADDGGGIAHYLRHLLGLPGALLEALGYLVAPAALFGAVRALRGPRPEAAWLLIATFALQLLAIPVLRSNLRFLSGYGVLLLPFAGLTWRVAAPALRARHLAVPAIVLTFAADLGRLPQARRDERIVERELGAYFGTRLGAGETIVSDMPRLDGFAGVEPGPPRAVTAAELVERAAAPGVRVVARVDGRTALRIAQLRPLGFAPLVLPAELAAAAAARRIVVVGR
jgi:hypothetical protein